MAGVCPECGLECGERSMPRARWTSARRIVPLAVLLLALVGVTIQSARMARSWEAPVSGATFAPSRAVGDGYTWDEIESIHDRGADGSLRDAILESAGEGWGSWPDASLRARFLPPTGEVERSVGVGWPSPWVTVNERAQYRNAPERREPVARVWNELRPLMWQNGFRTIDPPTDATPRASIRRVDVAPGAICLTVLVVLAAMVATLVAARLAGRKPTRRGRLALLAVLIGLVGLLAGASVERRETTTLSAIQTDSTWTWPLEEPPERVDLGLTEAQVREAPDGREIDEIIAGAILAAVAEPEADHVLAAQFEPPLRPGTMTVGFAGWPWLFVMWMDGDGSRGATRSLENGVLTIRWGEAARLGLDLEPMAGLVVGVLLVWWGCWAVMWGFVWMRTRRRVRRGLCVGCGYPRVDGGSA